MAHAHHLAIGTVMFPDMDTQFACGSFPRLDALHLAKHSCPSLVGATKVDRYHLERTTLCLYLTNAQTTVEQVQSLEEIMSASRSGDRQARLRSGQFGSSCGITVGRFILDAISEVVILC
jgi:hypothetical protein